MMGAVVFSPALADAICARIADGQSLREICRSEGMPGKSTVMQWLAARPDFADQYARAREMQADHFADEILEISDDGSNDWMTRRQGDETITVADHEHISRSKLRVDARKWLMSKMAPKKYGDRIIHAGDASAPIETNNKLALDGLDADERATLRSLLARRAGESEGGAEGA